MSRYDFPIPYGWFYICDSTELEPGQLQPLRRFSRDLVLWRDMQGGYHVQDAYCPHLGANIAVGGVVKDNTIECPFHAWRFNTDGSVAAIPYAKRINENACLSTYPVVQHYNWIMAWYHPQEKQPLFELPKVPKLEDKAFKGPFSQAHTIKTCLQEMAENTVDSAHFQTIHQHPGPAEYDKMAFEGHSMIMESRQHFPSSRGSVEGTLSAYTAGFGFAVVEYTTLIEMFMISTQAPIEKDLSMQVNHVYYHNPEGDERTDRIGHAFVEEVNRQFRDDIPIWENKIYRAKPELCDGDGPFNKFRKWAQQFYVEEA
ncbi:Rieske (2Fe-2S) protein [Parahaliea sp. F7430]|uniref:cholesterol 7-desaturase n=1 Tax=Sediminihaliea albiluteola TaxID=2758564 RepID=A0A7W2TXF0_9GAMM|nr:Rieske 2Fe-2S domain-containing protein [Sediminihaliea albiluteola]MBA6413700.1 Rieske (2Fe-2S) protein [Sediminihaliea albiluteola]